MFPNLSNHHEESTKSKQSRTLVLCFDGTADEFDEDNSNVVKFHALLKKGDEDKQMIYYQPGIGTYFKPGVVSPLLRHAASLLDFAVAWYLDEHVSGGYRFLMQNYRQGDKICLFGFSRGAYIARALAGFLNKIGLLLKDNEEQVAFAYKLYKRTDTRGVKLASNFKKTFCRDVKIEFVGVWDTVASVGILNGRTLPFTTSNDAIKTFRHALSLDERRVKFRPNMWHRPSPVTRPGKGEMHSPDGPPPPPPTPSPRLPVVSDVLDMLFRPPTPLSLDPHAAPHSAVSEPASTSGGVGRMRASSLTGGPSSPCKTNFTDESVPDQGEDGFDTHDVSPLPRSESPIKAHPKPSRWALASTKVKTLLNDQSSRIGKSVERTEGSENTENDIDDDDIPIISHEVHEDVSDAAGKGTMQGNTLVNGRGGGPDMLNTDDAEPDVLEVWFAGVHADVGGGSTSNSTSRSLSNITLRWMVREVITAQCGIIFDQRALSQYMVQTSLTGSPIRAGGHEKALNALDVGAPICDQMRTAKGVFWWLLELIPLPETWQDKSGHWRRKWGINLGRGRRIPESDIPPNFHITVRDRMQNASLEYTPRARWTPGTEIYVE